jgi:trehalose 6-phosphate phosphatase
MTLNAGSAPHTLSSPPTEVRGLALFLDMDGVLAPLAPTPDEVVPDPRRTAILRRLVPALDGRLAIISGRTLSEIDRITDGASPSASGVHGLTIRRRDGSVATRAADPAVRSVVAAFDAFAATRPGVIVEDKSVSAGLHYRGAPDAAEDAEQLARKLADETGLAIQPGELVFEVKTPGTDKGTALTAFMAEPPFAGGTPVMFGDDLTDEHAFRAAEALGGFGVLVGPMRETAARYRLAGVPEVLDWLEAVAATVGEGVEA